METSDARRELTAAIENFLVAADGVSGDAEHGAAVELVDSAQRLLESTKEAEEERQRRALISRKQIRQWSGRSLTDEQFERLAQAIPHSSIPDAIDTIVNEAMADAWREEFEL